MFVRGGVGWLNWSCEGMRVRLEEISEENITDLVDLLGERNKTSGSYIYWKYRSGILVKGRGLIARLGSQAVGCFGFIQRSLEDEAGRRFNCGWFADWYVRKGFQGRGIGRILLKGLLGEVPVLMGHPSPLLAGKLCQSEGLRRIPFQARHRAIVRPWRYERLRTRYLVKACIAFSMGRLRRKQNLAGQTQPGHRLAESGNVQFVDAEECREWMSRQTVAPCCSRTVGTWSAPEVEIGFIDDRLPSGMVRRRTMHWSGERQADLEAWLQFLEHAEVAGCVYVEIFTTNHEIDCAWRRMGAIPIAEPPVLVRGLAVDQNLNLCGWDRENWSYLAAE